MPRMRFPTLVVVLAALGALVSACASPGSSESVGDSPARESGAAEPRSSAPPPGGVPIDAWRAILADISERLGAPVAEPSVIRAEAVTWSDGALGCPEPGGMYTQALVDGYQVVIEVDGQEYDYRVGHGTDVRLCENPPLGG